VPTKTPNRSEYQTNKDVAKQSLKQHASVILQAPFVVKSELSADDTATEKTQTESPTKHRKIVRGFQQSKSTKVLAPNTVQLEKAVKPLMNNMTILTEVSERGKHSDLVGASS